MKGVGLIFDCAYGFWTGELKAMVETVRIFGG
jgi:hypothetical protein